MEWGQQGPVVVALVKATLYYLFSFCSLTSLLLIHLILLCPAAPFLHWGLQRACLLNWPMVLLPWCLVLLIRALSPLQLLLGLLLGIGIGLPCMHGLSVVVLHVRCCFLSLLPRTSTLLQGYILLVVLYYDTGEERLFCCVCLQPSKRIATTSDRSGRDNMLLFRYA